MPYNRKTIRLKGYDYAQAGVYSVTICAQDRICHFGYIRDGKMISNDAGRTVENNWIKLPRRFPCVGLDDFIIMPNHMHGIINIVGAPFMGAQNVNMA